jgi:hypothetical protein
LSVTSLVAAQEMRRPPMIVRTAFASSPVDRLARRCSTGRVVGDVPPVATVVVVGDRKAAVQSAPDPHLL